MAQVDILFIFFIKLRPPYVNASQNYELFKKHVENKNKRSLHSWKEFIFLENWSILGHCGIKAFNKLWPTFSAE